MQQQDKNDKEELLKRTPQQRCNIKMLRKIIERKIKKDNLEYWFA